MADKSGFAHDKIRIERFGEGGIFYKTYINDVEVKGVRSIQVNLSVESIPIVTLEVIALNLELPEILGKSNIESVIPKNRTP